MKEYINDNSLFNVMKRSSLLVWQLMHQQEALHFE